MTVLSTPRHPLVDKALRTARDWCAGHRIDDAPALAHAVRVAVELGRHVPDARPELLAAVLLHDSPDLVGPEVALDVVLQLRFGPEVVRIVRALEREHQALDQPNPPLPDATDLPVLLAGTADKAVALTALLRRAVRSGDTAAFWTARPGLLRLLPYFRACHTATAPHVPASMATALHVALGRLERSTARLG